MKAKRQHIGTVGIDAGMLYLGDPCYVARTPLGKTANDTPGENEGESNWYKFLDQVGEFDTAATVEGALPNGQTKFPAGMVVHTGYGDGEYDVYITTTEHGLVASVTVVFIPD